MYAYIYTFKQIGLEFIEEENKKFQANVVRNSFSTKSSFHYAKLFLHL
jgi:hypothetical protein